MFDFTQVLGFAAKLATSPVDETKWQRDESEALAAAMDPPVRTGTLASSIRPTSEGVAIDAHYWPYLEYGTSKMGPRPFIRPAVNRRTPEAVKELQKQVLGSLT